MQRMLIRKESKNKIDLNLELFKKTTFYTVIFIILFVVIDVIGN